MEKLQQAILHYITKYSADSTRKTLGIVSTVAATHIRVLAISATEGIKKALWKIGKKYHKMIVLVGDSRKQYSSLDTYLKDIYLIDNMDRRFVRYVEGSYIPIDCVDKLGDLENECTLFNTNYLWSLRFADYRVVDGYAGRYINPISYLGEGFTIELKSLPSYDALRHFEIVNPKVCTKYKGHTITSVDLEYSKTIVTETMVQHDLELTGLTVNESGEYVLRDDRVEDAIFDAISYGEVSYLEDMIYKNTERSVIPECEINTLEELIISFKKRAKVENDMTIEEATKAARALLDTPAFQDLKNKYLG